MPEIIAIHSFRGGTGKSNTAANLACLLARQGRRVGVVDTDIQSPGIHVLFNLDPKDAAHTLNDFLWGKCDIGRAVYDVSRILGPEERGKLFLIPSSIRTGDIARVLHYGYDINLLKEGYQQAIEQFALDYLFIDTHPGLNEETLMSIAIADTLLILLRPDQQDYQGTAVTVEVSRALEVPRMFLIVNKAPASLCGDALAAKVAATYNCDVAGVLPHADEMMELGSSGIFCLTHPDSSLGRAIDGILRRIET
ncbi:MAG: MinD/ParA family protein [Smithellaceae bacterium]|nr:MinD/ParA family protein [Syntrophaceae bacterium]MDD4242578.1 MinD/ParA family protein [Smithellaceae bacterium]NLX50689.1 MinD/ParA family protein [Deltaproteobacteria bacterium]